MLEITPQPTEYVGRFAPSPTGPLHLGSLVAALASYLDARHHQGKWLVRIEDIDPPREQAGATGKILDALDAHGLSWDAPVLHQGQRTEIYRETATRLIDQKKAFYCSCSRKQLHGHAIYPGTCRTQEQSPAQPAATRISAIGELNFVDRIQGPQHYNMVRDIGDFVIFRKDNLPAYQLATALDEHLQGVTHVVRGSDLLDSTPRQMYLHQTLGVASPSYAHIPVLTNANGQKLSKQNLAPALDLNSRQKNLFQALNWLNQNPPEHLQNESPAIILDWAISNWSIKNIAAISSIQIN